MEHVNTHLMFHSSTIHTSVSRKVQPLINIFLEIYLGRFLRDADTDLYTRMVCTAIVSLFKRKNGNNTNAQQEEKIKVYPHDNVISQSP